MATDETSESKAYSILQFGMSSPAATPHGAQGPGPGRRSPACATRAGHRRRALRAPGAAGSTGGAGRVRNTGTRELPERPRRRDRGSPPALPATRVPPAAPSLPLPGPAALTFRSTAAPHRTIAGQPPPGPRHGLCRGHGAGGRAGSRCRTVAAQIRPRCGPAGAQARPGPARPWVLAAAAGAAGLVAAPSPGGCSESRRGGASPAAWYGRARCLTRPGPRLGPKSGGGGGDAQTRRARGS